MPDVSGCLFLTFTVNPLLYANPAAAFEDSRKELRRIFFALRRGVKWDGKTYTIDAPYAVKVEFHGNEWAHFHVIFLTRRFLPGALLNAIWELGRTNVKRINNEDFRYLLKYVTKSGTLPDWVRDRKRLRVFQASRGFYVGEPREKPAKNAVKKRRRRSDETLGERVDRYRHTALLQRGDVFGHVSLSAPFDELHAQLVYPSAMDGRYLGKGHYQIDDIRELEQWTKTTSQ